MPITNYAESVLRGYVYRRRGPGKGIIVRAEHLPPTCEKDNSSAELSRISNISLLCMRKLRQTGSKTLRYTVLRNRVETFAGKEGAHTTGVWPGQ